MQHVNIVSGQYLNIVIAISASLTIVHGRKTTYLQKKIPVCVISQNKKLICADTYAEQCVSLFGPFTVMV